MSRDSLKDEMLCGHTFPYLTSENYSLFKDSLQVYFVQVTVVIR